MTDLIVLVFPTEGGARQVLGVVSDLQRQQPITLDYAATVVRGLDGKPQEAAATTSAAAPPSAAQTAVQVGS
jgi:uncharacterized membrane protein